MEESNRSKKEQSSEEQIVVQGILTQLRDSPDYKSIIQCYLEKLSIESTSMSFFLLLLDISPIYFCKVLITECINESIDEKVNSLQSLLIPLEVTIMQSGLFPFVFNDEFFWKFPFSYQLWIVRSLHFLLGNW